MRQTRDAFRCFHLPNATSTEKTTVDQNVTLLNSISTSFTNESVAEKKLSLAGRYE